MFLLCTAEQGVSITVGTSYSFNCCCSFKYILHKFFSQHFSAPVLQFAYIFLYSLNILYRKDTKSLFIDTGNTLNKEEQKYNYFRKYLVVFGCKLLHKPAWCIMGNESYQWYNAILIKVTYTKISCKQKFDKSEQIVHFFVNKNAEFECLEY